MLKRRITQALGTTLVVLCSCKSSPFVGVRDGHFILGGDPHSFVGVNFWQGMNLGVDGPSGDRTRLLAELDHLKELGISNLRVMASSEGPSTEPYRIAPALMIAPGEYDDRVFEGLDFLIAEAAARRMHIVLVLNNFWEWSGGMAQYVSWHERSTIPYPAENDWRVFCEYSARFYTYPICQQWYLNHIAAMINRINCFTNRAYRDEPAIFAWELANEPRYYAPEWVEETARHIKSLDPNHLVTVGSEGEIGGPFVPTHRSPVVDYTTIHIWPQNWGWFEPTQPETFEFAKESTADYVAQHLEEARQLGKPLVVEEFGLARDWDPLQDPFDSCAPTTLRNEFFSKIYEQVLKSVEQGGPLQGSNLWAWSGLANPGDSWLGDPPHETPGWYSVYGQDTSTLDMIRHHASQLQRRLHSDVP